MLDYIKKDISHNLDFLINIHLTFIYLLDYNLLAFISKFILNTLLGAGSISRSLKWSLGLIVIINLVCIIQHSTSTVTPGVIIDFIGEEPSVLLLVGNDILTIVFQAIYLFVSLQDGIVRAENEYDYHDYVYTETELDVISILQTYWNYPLIGNEDSQSINSNSSTVSAEYRRLPV